MTMNTFILNKYTFKYITCHYGSKNKKKKRKAKSKIIRKSEMIKRIPEINKMEARKKQKRSIKLKIMV